MEIERNPVFSSHPGMCQIKSERLVLVYKVLEVQAFPGSCFRYQSKLDVRYILSLPNENLERR